MPRAVNMKSLPAHYAVATAVCLDIPLLIHWCLLQCCQSHSCNFFLNDDMGTWSSTHRHSAPKKYTLLKKKEKKRKKVVKFSDLSSLY